MLYPSINEIRKKVDSRYTLVITAAKRARDLIDGKPAMTDTAINKPVSIAAHELAEDLISYKRGEDAIDSAVDAGAEEEAEEAVVEEAAEEAPEEEAE
ncbi:MAG: DNA-directed RNA polymerase subunit omega [Eubacterium sp.]|jgi:DNA-directed RNA polymerase subunit omega|nr:DNA-directed RNA polymerase subunit omega [Eubacterium sp.]